MNVPDYDITDATVIDHGVLRLVFADGTTDEVDVLDRMHGPVFDRTPQGFAEVAVDSEIGTGAWPSGADLAPDTLYERVRTGAWPQRHVQPERAALNSRRRRPAPGTPHPPRRRCRAG